MTKVLRGWPETQTFSNDIDLASTYRTLPLKLLNPLRLKCEKTTEAAVLFQKTQRLPSASLGSDMKQMDELKPGEQPLVSKKPNAAWHSNEHGCAG